MRQLTIALGVTLIFISFIRLFGLYEPNSLLLFSISVSACLFAGVDLILETKRQWWIDKIKIMDKIGLLIFIFPLVFSKSDYDFESLLKTPTDFLTLLAFGFVITTIGKKDLNYLEKTINDIKVKYFVEKNKSLPTMEGKIAKKAVKELAVAEYNTFLQLNKIIIELQRCDNITHYQQRVHNGWSILHETISYYELASLRPFYDHKLNEIFFSFYQEVGKGSEYYESISDPDTALELAKINFLKIEIEVASCRILRNHNGRDEGHQHIKNSLQYWNQLKQLVSARYEEKGFSDEIKNDEEKAAQV